MAKEEQEQRLFEARKKREAELEEAQAENRERQKMAEEEEEQRRREAWRNREGRGQASIKRWGQFFPLRCAPEHVPAVQQSLGKAWEERDTWTPKTWADRLEQLRRDVVDFWGSQGRGGQRRGVARSHEIAEERKARLAEEARARRALESERRAERLRAERVAGTRCACTGRYPYGGKRRRLSKKTVANWCNEHREWAPSTRLASSPAAPLWPQVAEFQDLWLCTRCKGACGKAGCVASRQGKGPWLTIWRLGQAAPVDEK